MGRVPRVLFAGVLALPFTIHLYGCSIIGLKVGESIDRSNSQIISPPDRVIAVTPGVNLTLATADGLSRDGKFVGIVRQDSSRYARRYAAWRDTIPAPERWPLLGDSVTVEMRDGRLLATRFRGFGYRAMDVDGASDANPDSLRYEDLDRITLARGASISGDSLLSMDAAIALPERTAIRLSVMDSPVTIPLDQARTVTIKHDGAAVVGFLIGLAVDVGVVVLVIQAANRASEDAAQGTQQTADACGSVLGHLGPTGVYYLDGVYDRRLGRVLEPALATR